MNIRIIGSGAWQGIPAPFCSCVVCSEARDNPIGLNSRTRPALFFQSGVGSFLLEASPDIRLQSTRWHMPDISHFVISHYHFDHMRGLAELHTYFKEHPECTIYGSQRTADMIRSELAYLPLQVRVIRPFEVFHIHDFRLTAFPVYHERVRDEDIQPDQLENTFGFKVEHNEHAVSYLADYYKIPARSGSVIQDSSAVIADGTYLMTDAYQEKKPNHLHSDDIIATASSFGVRHVYYHSISHLSGQTHAALQAQLPKNHFVSFDGMNIEL